MAVTSKIPPQAYTRDTLVKAIEWLSGQPAAVRERANSADLIVSHYLQANRHAHTASDMPVSQEAFKADLRHLAEDLKQFEAPSPPHSAPSRSFSYDPYVRPPVMRPAERPEPPPVRPTEVTVKGVVWTVDQRSISVARELQEALNLSNEGEALRMLVALGAERARGMFLP